MATEKNYDSKNIKFFYSNEDDVKILKFFEKNKKMKFGTLVKCLLLNYIDGDLNSTSNNVMTKEQVELIVQREITKHIKSSVFCDNKEINKEIVENHNENKIDVTQNILNDADIGNIKVFKASVDEKELTDEPEEIKVEEKSKPNLLGQLRKK
ncbi:UNVERIFIED_ORG: hypothetical protein B2H98_08120 [Clostridium botulinum]